MSDYSKEDFARLIQAYNEDMMSKYRDRIQQPAPKIAPDAPAAVAAVSDEPKASPIVESLTPKSTETATLQTESAMKAITATDDEDEPVVVDISELRKSESVEPVQSTEEPVSAEDVTIESTAVPFFPSVEPQADAVSDDFPAIETSDEVKSAATENHPLPSPTAQKEPESIPIATPDLADTAAASQQQSDDNGLSRDQTEDRGYLQVRVSTEHQAIPIPNAKVNISHTVNNREYLDYTMTTDEDGLTPLVTLYTKNRDLSLTPGNTKPFTAYTINVSADGYYPERFVDVPIFGGVTSVQSVNLIPVAEAGDDDMVIIYPQRGPTL